MMKEVCKLFLFALLVSKNNTAGSPRAYVCALERATCAYGHLLQISLARSYSLCLANVVVHQFICKLARDNENKME
jgi:hypothetical protein